MSRVDHNRQERLAIALSKCVACQRRTLAVPTSDLQLATSLWLASRQWPQLVWGTFFGVAVDGLAGGPVDRHRLRHRRQRQPRAAPASSLGWTAVAIGLGAVQAVSGTDASQVRGHQLADGHVPDDPARGSPRRADWAQRCPPRSPPATSSTPSPPTRCAWAGCSTSPRASPARSSRGSGSRSTCSRRPPPSARSSCSACPILMVLTVPMMRPLHSRQAVQREVVGKLTALGADTVAGLRVLRGLGGEEEFLGRYRVPQRRGPPRRATASPAPQALLESGQVLLPALLVAAVTLLTARLVVGRLARCQQMIAFYGLTAFLTMPLRTATEGIIAATRGLVGARKVIAVLKVEPSTTDAVRPRDPAGARWRARRPALGVRGAARLHHRARDRDARGGPGHRRPPRALHAAGCRGVVRGDARRHAAARAWRSTRCAHRVVVSDVDPRLFSGTLRDELSPHASPDDAEILRVDRARERRGRPRRARRRPRHARRGARAELLGRPAPAPRARARAPHGPRVPRARRADLRGRHAHRGPDRSPPARGARASTGRSSRRRARCSSSAPTRSSTSPAAPSSPVAATTSCSTPTRPTARSSCGGTTHERAPHRHARARCASHARLLGREHRRELALGARRVRPRRGRSAPPARSSSASSSSEITHKHTLTAPRADVLVGILLVGDDPPERAHVRLAPALLRARRDGLRAAARGVLGERARAPAVQGRARGNRRPA